MGVIPCLTDSGPFDKAQDDVMETKNARAFRYYSKITIIEQIPTKPVVVLTNYLKMKNTSILIFLGLLCNHSLVR